jgi:hypothetical protein
MLNFALRPVLSKWHPELTAWESSRPGQLSAIEHPSVVRRYDYVRAARGALHFGKLLDRWCQNLRRVAGYDVQYFATVELQKRGAPHAHFAIRGTLPRALVKELTAAIYAQVWWPSTDSVVYADPWLPEWDPAGNDGDGGYVDPDDRQPLPTWVEALDTLTSEDGQDDEAVPLHVARFGAQVDVKGVLAGSPEAERCIGYLVKYLVKDLGDDHNSTDQLDDEYDDVDTEQDDEPPSRVDAKPLPSGGWITSPGSSMPRGTSRAHPGARTGCGPASNPRTPPRHAARLLPRQGPPPLPPRVWRPPRPRLPQVDRERPRRPPPRAAPTSRLSSAAPPTTPSPAVPQSTIRQGGPHRSRAWCGRPPATPRPARHRPRHSMASRIPHRPGRPPAAPPNPAR